MEKNSFTPRKPTVEEEALKGKIRTQMILDRCRLLERQPFIGHLAMRLELKPVIDCRMNTASTDGSRLFVDAEFYQQMDEEERLGILGHEVWHCALRHFARRGDRDIKMFNYAADVETDLLLYNAGFKVEILPYDKKWIGLSAEQIYEVMLPAMANFQKEDLHLYSDQQPSGKFPKPQSENDAGEQNNEQDDKTAADSVNAESGDSENGEPNDFRKEETSVTNASVSGDGKNSVVGKGGARQGDTSESSGGIACGIETTLPRITHDTVFDPDFDPKFSEDIAEEWKENLKQEYRREKSRGSKSIGNIPGNVEELIKDDERSATVDWKRVLLDFVTQIFGGERQWLPPARRYVWKKLVLRRFLAQVR